MQAQDYDNDLLRDHRSHLQGAAGPAAFDVLVAVATELPGYRCHPAWHGDIRDFRYIDAASNEWPYAFIVNRHDLLFYVRKPGLARVPGGLDALRARFTTVKENPSGEWTIRIAGALDAAGLSDLLFGSRAAAASESRSALLAAVAFAADKHRHQRRKDEESSPYINHPIALAELLASVGVNEGVVLLAALLHDTVEDTATTFDELEQHFGSRVAGIVREVTDDKSLAKEERKRLQVEHAPSLSREAKLVKLADKICNLHDIQSSPPMGWSVERKREYFDWAKRVVDRLRGVNPQLEQLFYTRYANRP
jgi:GTP diphosphokinase / guanosine-3',5'-bis(diphosphate) 3'-diphosphatase